MSEQSAAFVVAGVLIAGALVMFFLERRAVARRKASGRYVDPSDIFFYKQQSQEDSAQSKS